jgi:hypothetical protein
MSLRDVYVSASGNNSSGDGSIFKPWATIAGALRKAQPGDAIHVGPGSYDCSDAWVDGTTGAAQGTLDHPIWVVGDSSPVIDCGDASTGSTTGLQLHGVKYVVIDGIEFRNAGTHILHVDGQSLGVLFKRVWVHGAGMACLKASQSEGVSVEDSLFSDAGLSSVASQSEASGQIIDYVGVHNSHVARSVIRGAMGNGQGSAGNVAMQFKGGSQNILIAQNDIFDANTAINLGGSTGPQFFDPPDADYEGKSIFAYANVISGAVSVAFAAIGCHQCGIYNNTVYAPIDKQAIRALPGATAAGGTSHTIDFDVKNNLLYFFGATPQDLFNATPGDQVGITQAANLFYAPGKAIASLWSDVAVTGTTGVILDQDPLLVAPPSDVRLGAGSPAIGAGVPLPAYAADHSGACRTTWDIGALAAK